MKILVIDDDPDIVEVVCTLFELHWSDSHLVSVGDGATGLALLSAEDPDIVILDLGLPDMDGFEVLREIRCVSYVPVVILTVRGGEDDTTKALDLGADDYIQKPFSPLVLLARVQAVYSRSQLGGRSRRAWGRVIPPPRTSAQMVPSWSSRVV